MRAAAWERDVRAWVALVPRMPGRAAPRTMRHSPVFWMCSRCARLLWCLMVLCCAVVLVWCECAPAPA